MLAWYDFRGYQIFEGKETPTPAPASWGLVARLACGGDESCGLGDFVSDAPRKGGLFVIHVADGCSLAIVDELASSEE